MPQKARDVKKALETKGFREQKRDHWYYHFYHNGKKSQIYTKISYGETDISNMLCSAMARQIKLSGRQFESFIECTLTGEMYLKVLIDGKHITVEAKPEGSLPQKQRKGTPR